MVGRADHKGGILAAPGSVFWHSDSEFDLLGLIGGKNAGRVGNFDPVYHAGALGDGAKVYGVFFVHHGVRGDSDVKFKIRVGGGGIGDHDAARVGLAWRESDGLAHGGDDEHIADIGRFLIHSFIIA